MGFSVSAAFSILFIATLMSMEYIYSSVDFAIDSAEDGFSSNVNDRFKAYNADIDILNVTVTSGSDYDLYINIKNSGSITLRSDESSFLVEGKTVTPDYYSDVYHLPDKNLTVRISNLPNNGTKRLKVITEYGNSAYMTYEVP